MYVHDADLSEFVKKRLAEGRLTIPIGQPIYTERRRDKRYGINQRASMYTVYPVSSKRRTALLHDISNSGLLVEAALPELVGSSVRIQMTDVFIIGEVRHCREIGDKCLIGVRIEAVLYEVTAAAGHRTLEVPSALKIAG